MSLTFYNAVGGQVVRFKRMTTLEIDPGCAGVGAQDVIRLIVVPSRKCLVQRFCIHYFLK
jgi:hypothetical protein